MRAALQVPPGLKILDLGCGSGAFLAELASLRPKLLDALDPNQAMIDKALERVRISPLVGAEEVHIRRGDITGLDASSYDVVVCAQILQNLTPDPERAPGARATFLSQVLRLLKPGGKLVLTTRAVSTGAAGRWSDLYWYADPAVVPRAVRIMERMVPRDPLAEMARAGFSGCKLLASKDTVVRPDAYLEPFSVKNPSFRAADSFFQHVRSDELRSLLANIERRAASETLDEYVRSRDALREGNGHVATIVGYKPAD
ncbi:hypothetical protein CYMTET_6942 [Cymbomonas tetramitiformis]|uniref:Methyltransferase type 12 domain-containing protein n=1 Tax=Cymbomonas tetramitiformis TaxID=36881 RepID=A0AAE0FUI5_9CHLO|nr:hypothetical protein CYMTET_25201 [Cymbomonas tetramitiformis]KAK3285456.1 hypothetical protein CYMTET_6942 [Cymbomonas tetramitiformis]